MTGAAVEHRPLGAADLAGLPDLIIAFTDVTAKLQASHDLLRSEVARLTRELGEANSQLERARRLAALGEMAAGIAHEVRNPLGSIRLYARMLEQDLTDRPGEMGIAVKIAGAARAMEGVVTDILTFAKEFRLRPEGVDVSDLFDRVLESCCHDGVPGWRGVEVVRADKGAGLTVEADPSLLCQALVNVVRNAFEAMAETPGRSHRLVLSAASRACEGGAGDEVVLSVRDSGPGVSDEVVARMFNPFFTTRGAGTGLGLAIVHRIIDAHAGRIAVTNNDDGVGATVEIALPLAEKVRANQPPIPTLGATEIH